MEDRDAEEAFELLTDSRLLFVHQRPASVQEMRSSIARGRSGDADPNLIHYEWVVRVTGVGVLVALISCNMMRRTDLRSVNGVAEEFEKRAVEPTAYVHPDHQGQGYGPEAVAAVEYFAIVQYAATESRPRIDHRNTESKDRARRAGAERVLPATIYDPLETWMRPLA